MDVKLPNGAIIKGVPDGTPKNVIMQKAISAGYATAQDFPEYKAEQVVTPDISVTQELVAASPRMQRAESMRQDQTRAESELPELADSGLLSSADPAKIASVTPAILTAVDPREIADILQSNFPEIGIQYDEKGNILAANNETGARTIINKPGLSKMDLLQTIGIGAAFTPAGRAATIPAAIGKSMLTEAAIQGGQAVSGGEFNEEDVLLSGALGGGGKAIEKAISGVRGAATGAIPEDQAALIQSGREAGVPVMTSDVIEPTTFAGKVARSTGEKIPLAGTGAARAQQQQMRTDAVEQFVEQYQTPSYGEIIASLKDKSKGVRRAAGNVLSNTGSKLDDIGDIPVDNTRMAISDAVDDLSKPNVRADQGAIDELIQLEELMSMPQTFTSLKENRTIFRDIIESFGTGERSQLPTRSKALLQKAASGMSKDMDDFAKSNLTAKEFASWKKANQVYAGEAQKLKKTKLKNILDKGDFTPENVDQLLLSKKPSEVKSLYDSLTTTGKQNARSALIMKAYDNSSKRAGGMTPNTFATELQKLQNNTNIFFKGKDRKQLEGFKRLMNATRRAQDAAVETPTGQQVLGAGAGYAAFTDLGATLGLGGTAGGLARLYESAPVRNALLKLGSARKGSDAFDRALTEVQTVLTSYAQAEKSKELAE